ncbi:MAG: hypothetical protein KC635_03380 [Myxococcales bacterium]|nr:hypothetical protein [Myxococcales bacterium]MCB9598496.1 hypothetical protein [Sandaracinaceae bacterium]MCB9733295.1 hypothetical protein [Deltaproteobacteria bacterium]
MSDAETLWVLAVGIYLAETLLLVPRDAAVFRSAGRGGFRAVRPFFARRDSGPGLVMGTPWPPLGLLAIGRREGALLAPEVVRDRVGAWLAASRRVRGAAVALLVVTFAGSALVIWAPAGPWGRASGAWVFALVGALWALTGGLAVRLWRRQDPARRAPGKDLFTALASPLSAVRVHDVLGRNELADVSELALALALLSPEARAPVVRAALVRARGEGGAAEAALAATLSGEGVDVGAVLAPPAREDADAQAYCPLCLAEYRVAEGVCSTCEGVALVAFGVESR